MTVNELRQILFKLPESHNDTPVVFPIEDHLYEVAHAEVSENAYYNADGGIEHSHVIIIR